MPRDDRRSKVLDRAAREKVKFLRLQFTDILGALKNVEVPDRQFAEALDASVVICGPGDIADAHRPDEYVTLDQLLRCERFLCGLVQQICVDPTVEG